MHVSILPAHYLSEKHQWTLADLLWRFPPAMSLASIEMRLLADHLRRLQNQFHCQQESLQLAAEEWQPLRSAGEENHRQLAIIGVQQGMSREAIGQLVDRPLVSVNGKLRWKIAGIRQKMGRCCSSERDSLEESVFMALDDAKFERQRSIYSPEFFSSAQGYRMRGRLFLNGVAGARDTHLSIYFILMSGEYDSLLQWPFSYRVNLTLLDQSMPEDSRSHLRRFFWPEVSSTCFQRPRSDMNEAYGIENFLPLAQLQQQHTRFIPDDTMFLEIEIDFLSERPGNTPAV